MKVITTHSGADFDAISSLLAASKIYPDAVMFLPGSAEKKVREYIAEQGFPGKIAEFKELKEKKLDLLVVVDTRFKNRLGRIANLIDSETEIHLYDHHPRTDKDIKGDIDIWGKYGATTTMFIKKLVQQNIPLEPREATLMAMGIYEDTGCLTYPITTPDDIEAAAFLLRKGASLKIISKYIIHELNEKQVDLLNTLLNSKSYIEINHDKIVFVHAEILDYVEELAAVVHKVVDILKPDALFALVKIKFKVLCISRSRSKHIDVGNILSNFDGGGHPSAASATFEYMPIYDVKQKLSSFLIKNLRNKSDNLRIAKKPVRVIPVSHTANQAYHTLNHLNLKYAPVGDSRGNVTGIVQRSELEKALRHGLSKHCVTEFVTSRNPSVVESDDMKKTDSSLSPSYDYLTSKLENNLSRKVIEILKMAGKIADEMNITAYCVGGMVRDILMNIKHQDIDIVVEKKGIEFAKKLSEKLKVHVNCHEKFKTAVIKLPYREIDVATLRKEYYEFPAALPEVSFGTLKQDLYRRDFTINAMAIQINPHAEYGKLIDYFGSRKDLDNKTVSILYPLSFIEDPTRIFRAIRFEKRFNFSLDKDTLKQLNKTVHMDIHSRLTTDRVREEIILILKENKPHEILSRLGKLGVLNCINPRLKISGNIYNLIRGFSVISFEIPQIYEKLWQEKKWLIILLMMISELEIEEGKIVLKEFHFSQNFMSYYLQSKKYANRIINLLKRKLTLARIYKALHFLNIEVLFYVISICNNDEVRKKIIFYLSDLKHVKPAINGEELKNMGYTPNPLFSKILFILKLVKFNGTVKNMEEEKKFVLKFFPIDS